MTHASIIFSGFAGYLVFNTHFLKPQVFFFISIRNIRAWCTGHNHNISYKELLPFAFGFLLQSLWWLRTVTFMLCLKWLHKCITIPWSIVFSIPKFSGIRPGSVSMLQMVTYVYNQFSSTEMLPFIAFWSTPPKLGFPNPDPLSAIHNKFKIISRKRQ